MHPYGYQHQRTRATLIRAALGTRCPGATVNGRPYRSRNCDRVMTNPARMHLDHTLPIAQGGTVGDRICCQPCNTGAGAILGNTMRHQQRRRRLPTW